MASNPYAFDHSETLRDEPSLEELFAEPIIQLVMQRDGVEAHTMRTEIARLLASTPA